MVHHRVTSWKLLLQIISEWMKGTSKELPVNKVWTPSACQPLETMSKHWQIANEECLLLVWLIVVWVGHSTGTIPSSWCSPSLPA